MTYLAAEGDTWGIPGPTFLMIYFVLGVVVLGAVLLWRRRQLAGPTGSTRRQLTPTEVALLNGGRDLAVYSSLASLRAAEAVQVVNGHLAQVGLPSPGAPMLDRAIYTAAGQRTLRSRDVQSDPGVGAVLDRTEADLTAEGMLVTPAARSRVRRAALFGIGLLAFGVARAIAGHQNGKPITNLVLLLVLVAVATLALLAVPRLTSAAKASLTAMRRSSKHLRPASSPSWSTYGPASAALGVGLFGTAAIWAADPAFAADAEIQRQSIGSSGWTGGSDGGGGSSCGGGGCGGGGCGG